MLYTNAELFCISNCYYYLDIALFVHTVFKPKLNSPKWSSNINSERLFVKKQYIFKDLQLRKSKRQQETLINYQSL